MKLKLFILFLFAATICFLFFKRKEIFREKINGKVDKVLVVKSKREMYLIKKGKIIGTYNIALGDHPEGHKGMEGDERTPEGNYILDWRNSKSVCYRSIHISYPNKGDSESAKKSGVAPGDSIMIHGLHPSNQYLGDLHTSTDWTNGCIAVTNEEMNEIWPCVGYGTPIVIK
jgi:murein L,D-transpeptidase YafK